MTVKFMKQMSFDFYHIQPIVPHPHPTYCEFQSYVRPYIV